MEDLQNQLDEVKKDIVDLKAQNRECKKFQKSSTQEMIVLKADQINGDRQSYKRNIVISGKSVPQNNARGDEDRAANWCSMKAFKIPIIHEIEACHYQQPKKRNGKKSLIVTCRKKTGRSSIMQCLKKSKKKRGKRSLQIYFHLKQSPIDSMFRICAQKLKRWGKIQDFDIDIDSGKTVIEMLDGKKVSIGHENDLFRIISAEDKKKLITENNAARVKNPEYCILGNSHLSKMDARNGEIIDENENAIQN